jgi:site-specific DNA-cytosine methylase
MKVLVACEFSGRVRDAFSKLGHDAISCDLLDTESPGKHHKGDVVEILNEGWDLVIAFPPCTDLCVSGARWFEKKRADGSQQRSIDFFMQFVHCNADMVAIENPVGIMSTKHRKPDQVIQPWMFGHGETKATCLWLKNLPPLSPTQTVDGREQKIWKMPPGPERAKMRSLTYQGIADAMADQWGRVKL